MASKTVYVYPSDGAWAVKKDGKPAGLFVTKREAMEVAVRDGKKAKAAQVVVFGKEGHIEERRTYGLPRIQDPPKRGRLAPEKIAQAVGRVVLSRLQSDSQPSRAEAPAK